MHAFSDAWMLATPPPSKYGKEPRWKTVEMAFIDHSGPGPEAATPPAEAVAKVPTRAAMEKVCGAGERGDARV
jgi:hypothetical protein